jgi:phosphopantetheine--protein transferase-like protein
MVVKTGIDLVKISRFKESLKDPAFVSRIFSVEELKDNRPEHLAGFFAAKEAVIKALSLPVGAWHNIKLSNEPNGRPVVELLVKPEELVSWDISIAHEDDFSVATFVAILG